LTQLGLLPLTTSEEDGAVAYLFFPSREYGAATSQPLAVLASRWLDAVLGDAEATAPRVWLTPADVEAGRSIATAFRGSSDRPVVAINFGVGANPAKSVGTWFEAAIVATLLSDGAKIILDRGAGEDEAKRADALISFARDTGVRVAEVDEASLESLQQGSASSLPADGDLLVWTGRLGFLAALIAESDLYIGYDSAGQHIAAALGVPCIDVMGGYGSDRIVDRWRPTGPAETRVILVSGSVLEETIHHSRAMLAKRADR
ncbi:MAG TPA: glycosyltransferase family 9 protein, partial [Blastocatellia bacterium]|nr:glycosyltransferase family 9 protein [Blastocatellia bacterium]